MAKQKKSNANRDRAKSAKNVKPEAFRQPRTKDPGALNPTGLRRFTYHSVDSELPPLDEAPGSLADDHGGLDAETAARRYLRAMAELDLPDFSAAAADGGPAEFQCLGIHKPLLTHTTAVSFCQAYNGVPVHGSRVVVELDQDYRLISLNSAIGIPEGVNPVASISPAAALAKARELGGTADERPALVPQLYYYYDPSRRHWRLAYIIKDFPKHPSVQTGHEGKQSPVDLPPIVDFVIDAHDGELIRELSRVANQKAEVSAIDALGRSRTFQVVRTNDQPPRFEMTDPDLNVQTSDFEFKDYFKQRSELPGRVFSNPPPWTRDAVSAHANGSAAAAFVRDVLKRDGVDGRGGRLHITLNCVSGASEDVVWRNAAWYRGQAIFGQDFIDGSLRTFAASLSIVSHEVFHGVTEATARLDLHQMPGALNESYSDIFGVIISNYEKGDFDQWDWEIGRELSPSGKPLRDVSQPGRHDFPEHMDKYRMESQRDRGGVHINCGIHNLAAYKLITAVSKGKYLFSKEEVVALFYNSLTQLSANSSFGDSRAALDNAVKSMFRDQPAAHRKSRIRAVSAAFDAVGIKAPKATASTRVLVADR